jgi:hypothetical protein
MAVSAYRAPDEAFWHMSVQVDNEFDMLKVSFAVRVSNGIDTVFPEIGSWRRLEPDLALAVVGVLW